jgi:hypothetical protein
MGWDRDFVVRIWKEEELLIKKEDCWEKEESWGVISLGKEVWEGVSGKKRMQWGDIKCGTERKSL